MVEREPPHPDELLSYADVLDQHPDMHPDLQTHVRRLAGHETGQSAGGEMPNGSPEAVTTGGAVLRDFNARTRQLLASRDPSDARQFYPPSLDYEELDVLELGTCTAREFDEFLGEYTSHFRDNETGEFTMAPSMLHNVSKTLLRDAYLTPAPDGGPSATMDAVQSLSQNRYYNGYGIVALYDIYEVTDGIQFYKGGPHQQDPEVQRLLEDPTFIEGLVDRFVMDVRDRESELGTNRLTAMYDWSREFMQTAAKMPRLMSFEFMFIAGRRLNDGNKTGPTEFDYEKYKEALTNLGVNGSKLGGDNLQKLFDTVGMINFDTYEPDQLERMLRVLSGDAETIKHLQAGDVTVVFRDAFGDYNGGMNNVTTNYESPSGRTLYFEIQKPADIQRYKDMLKGLGVQPSTVVISGHGGDWGIAIGRDRHLAHESHPSPTSDDVTVYKLAEYLDDLMQNSKGIDEPDEAAGRRRVILPSCSQMNPVQVERVASDGTREVILRSMGESLAEHMESSNVDVYGGAKDISGKLTADGKSVALTAHIKEPDGSVRLEPLDVTVVTTGPDGQLVKTTAPAMRLWR